MNRVRPHVLVHRGVVDAVAFYFPMSRFTEVEMRTRVLALWVVGAVVYRLPDGVLLRLPMPRRTVCALSPGLPLTSQGTLLLAAPLRSREIEVLAPPPGSVLLVQNGDAVVYPLTNDAVEDPATWLDLDRYAVVPAESLGEPPAPPRLVADPVVFDARSRFANIPPVAPERQQIWEGLRTAAEQESKSFQERTAEGRPLPALLGWLVGWLLPQGSSTGHGGSSSASTGSATRYQERDKAPPPRPHPFDALQRLAARFLLFTGLSTIVGRKQAQYLRRMMELFERGQLDDALRYAIPLKGLPGDENAPPALTAPTPRADLQLTMQQSGGSSSAISLGESLYNDLESLYRRAITKLEAEGRIEEAAFILADLLQEYEEAVALLERHKKLQLAAELAEGQGLPPGLVVRLWFLAGDTDRAVQIARRSGAFADAVLRLERTDKDRADVLRGLWARSLARAGEYAAAVEAIWSIEAARPIAQEWIRRASEGGGIAGGKMLARLLLVQEDSLFETTRQRAIVLLEDNSRERAEERLAFAQELAKTPENPYTQPLARLAIRSLWRGASSGQNIITPVVFREILQAADDGALRTDVLPLPPVVSPSLQARVNDPASPLEIAVAGEDTGAFPLYDAVYLPNGQCFVALGEAGTRLLSRDGRTVVHFDQPTHRLVVSDGGNHVIGLAQRGSVWRLVRFDLISRKAAVWQDAALRSFASDYDGSLWFVAIGSDFLAIDATAPGFDALWRMPIGGGGIGAISRNATDCSLVDRFVLGDVDTYRWSSHPTDAQFGNPIELVTQRQRWHFVLPSLTLRDRDWVGMTGAIEDSNTFALSATGAYGEIYTVDSPNGDRYLELGLTPRFEDRWEQRVTVALSGNTARSCYLTEDWLLAITCDPGAEFVTLLPVRSTSPAARVVLVGATRVTARIRQQILTLCDDKGRLLVLSLGDGALLRNLRLS